MKKTLLCLLAASLMMTGCNSGSPRFSTQPYEGKRCMLLPGAESFVPDGDTLGVDNSYKIEWPARGFLSPDAEAELLIRCFDDSVSTSFRQAADRWLANTWLFEDEGVQTKLVDSLANCEHYNFARKEASITRDGNLATMLITTETFAAFAAHGLYSAQYVVMDLDTREIVHLNDLVDTAQLGEVIIRAIEDLAVNKDVSDCVFEEYHKAGRVAVPQDFFIDSTRSVINLVFQQYDIAPYACGIMTVSLPIFWLSKHIPLTPYCKELFGPGSSID